MLAYIPEVTFEAQALDFIEKAVASSGPQSITCNGTEVPCQFEADCQSAPLEIMPSNLVFLTVYGRTLHDDRAALSSSLRDVDTAKYAIVSDDGAVTCEALFDNRQSAQDAAQLRVYLTFCIVFILVVSGFVMSTEVTNLLSLPMQRLAKSQELSDALLRIFMSKTDPLPTLRESAKMILNAEVVNIYFMDEAENMFWCTHTPEDDTPYLDDLRIRVGVGLVGKAAERKIISRHEYQSLDQVPNDDPSLQANIPESADQKAYTWYAKEVLLLPLVQHKGKSDVVVGLVQAINKREESKAALGLVDNILKIAGCRKEQLGFNEFDMDMIEMLGDQVARILKGFQMDAMYENLFKESNDDDEAATIMQGLLADYATADVVMNSRHKHKKKHKSLEDLFNEIDTDGSGALDRKEIEELSTKLGADLDDSELDAAMAEMDADGSGEAKFWEFKRWWESSGGGKLKQAAKSTYGGDIDAAAAAVSQFLQGLQLPSRIELREWGHGCLDYDLDQIVGCSIEIFSDPELGLMDEFDLEPKTIIAFCKEAYSRYRKIPCEHYIWPQCHTAVQPLHHRLRHPADLGPVLCITDHNMYHGFNVLQGAYSLIMNTYVPCKSFCNTHGLSESLLHII